MAIHAPFFGGTTKARMTKLPRGNNSDRSSYFSGVTIAKGESTFAILTQAKINTTED